MAQQGGYQPPRKPAPVSGPGPLSKRTDGQPIRDLPNPAYGEGTQFAQIQQGARMEQAEGPKITPLGAPTQRPNEPVTAGSPSGPGPGKAALGIPSLPSQKANDFQALSQYMPLMERYANSDLTSGTMKSFVRYLRSQIQ